MSAGRCRVAVVLSHPVQYYSPWFRDVAARDGIDLRVFYLWDFGIREALDRDFGVRLRWDVPLLEGYASELVPNRAADPGTHHFAGLDNPDLVGALVGWRPDAIVLFGYAYRSHLRVLLSPRLRRVPMLLRGDSHELAPRRGVRSRMARFARRVLFTRFAAALAVGQANLRYLVASGIAPGRVFLAPHCVDNARFRADPQRVATEAAAFRARLGVPPLARVLLFVGKFEDKKRPLDLLDAFARVHASGQAGGTVLLLVGDGQQRAQLEARVAHHRLDSAVFFAPFQNQSQMPAVYAAGHVLVLPSFGSGETWGLCVNEAMNLGVPAIVSSHVGCGPDLVADGQTGWVVPAGEPDALAATLAEVASLPDAVLSRMGQAARDRVAAYDPGAATEGLLAALRALRLLPDGAGS